ncbi:MAG: hypothetical protein LBC40_08530 [Dysgonamonadaceae bacterium]|jgi:hypothetical protein|nr:hypothetical protein [Dysgonamonadaceae bacterium]
MKTSNYIVIAFVVFIIGGILVLFITDKNHEEKCLSDTYPLDGFSVIVAEPGARFQVRNEAKDFIELCAMGEKKVPVDLYRIDNDTLFLSSNSIAWKTVTVFCSGLSSINAKDSSRVLLKDFRSGNLHIEADRAHVSIEYSHLPDVSIIAGNESHIKIQNTKASSTDIHGNHSFVYLYSSAIDSLSVTLMNKTSFSAYDNRINTMLIRKDQTGWCSFSGH